MIGADWNMIAGCECRGDGGREHDGEPRCKQGRVGCKQGRLGCGNLRACEDVIGADCSMIAGCECRGGGGQRIVLEMGGGDEC